VTDPVASTFTTRRIPAGSLAGSAPPYAHWNLALHVGDDPAIVAANRALLASRLDVSDRHLRWMHQVHGHDVAVVDGPGDDVDAVDALVSSTPGVALAVLVADCLPVLLADPVSGVVAAVHAGRRGVASGVVPRALEVMRSLGAQDVWARIGPGVCGSCYEVSAEIHDEVADLEPATSSRTRVGTPALDLRAGVVAQLAGLGVTRVSAEHACTVEDPSFFSHRREGITGRFAGVVVLRP
jgi:YfiH family protein